MDPPTPYNLVSRPVDFGWIDLLIHKLKAGKHSELVVNEVVLKSEKDWLLLVEWYGPVRVKNNDGNPVLEVDVWPDLISVEMERRGKNVVFQLKRRVMDRDVLENFLTAWRSRRGDYLLNGQRKVVLLLDSLAWNWLSSRSMTFHHPALNLRLRVELIKNHEWGVKVRFCVIGIDPEVGLSFLT
uniref:FBA_2 domain-containing protein n=1 Tax=Steinernema glaseri TaxID=37863 RepID=A0A1I7ZYW4_9BILA